MCGFVITSYLYVASKDFQKEWSVPNSLKWAQSEQNVNLILTLSVFFTDGVLPLMAFADCLTVVGFQQFQATFSSSFFCGVCVKWCHSCTNPHTSCEGRFNKKLQLSYILYELTFMCQIDSCCKAKRRTEEKRYLFLLLLLLFGSWPSARKDHPHRLAVFATAAGFMKGKLQMANG